MLEKCRQEVMRGTSWYCNSRHSNPADTCSLWEMCVCVCLSVCLTVCVCVSVSGSKKVSTLQKITMDWAIYQTQWSVWVCRQEQLHNAWHQRTQYAIRLLSVREENSLGALNHPSHAMTYRLSACSQTDMPRGAVTPFYNWPGLTWVWYLTGCRTRINTCLLMHVCMLHVMKLIL